MAQATTVTAIVPTCYGQDLEFHILSTGQTVLVSQDRWHGPTVAGHPQYWSGWDYAETLPRREILKDGELYRHNAWRWLEYSCPWEQGLIHCTEGRYYKLRKQWREAMANY